MKIVKDKFESKRFTLVAFSFIILSTMGIWSMIVKMEAVAVAVVGTLTMMIMWYIKKESDRPSVVPSSVPKTQESEQTVSQR